MVLFLKPTEVSVNKLALAAVLLAAPLAARAEVGLRLGLDASVAYHDQQNGGSTHFITDNFPLGADVMLSYWTPGSLLAIDLELGEAFYLSPPGAFSSRIGTILRPGVRLSPPILPVYLRAAIPISLEAPAEYDAGRTYGLRLGAGITIPLVLFKVYVEGDIDTPLGGGKTGAPKAFDTWNLVLNGGLDFRF